MIARVTRSANVHASLIYGQNPAKGGEVFLLNETDGRASPKEQADDWLAMANPYRTMCYNIVISMSMEDTKKIRNIDSLEKRVDFERRVIEAFLRELNRRGNNVFDCPFVVAHHGNTECEHFHITVLTTTVDGRRFNDRFIKKNACRSAAKVSEEYGLEAAPRALTLERRHQVAQGRRKSSSAEKPVSAAEDNRRKRGYTRVEKGIGQMRERRERIIKAEKRKKQCRYLIESLVKDKGVTADSYLSRLAANGIRLYLDPYEKCLYVEMRDEDEGKLRTYSLEKELEVDISLLSRLGINVPVKERADKVDTKKYQALKEKVLKEEAAKAKAAAGRTSKAVAGRRVSARGSSSMGRTAKSSSRSSLMPSARSLGGMRQDNIGPQGGQTQPGDVNPDGSRSHSDDDMDEEWKRRNGGYYR
jgi:hypothetical protein